MIEGFRRFAAGLSPRSRFLSTFDDRFAGFTEAAQAAGGYDDRVIDDRSLEAARSVIEGNASFERDGVAFAEPDPRQPVVEAIVVTHQSRAGKAPLRLLDVGGGLGSAYWQNIELLPANELAWTIVERPSLCEKARELPEHPIVYRSDLEQALNEQWDVILFSSVLQYLAEPHQVLVAAGAVGSTIIVDRTPMHAGADDAACVQTTPAHIYAASYPAWIFGAGTLEADIPGWRIISRFPGIEPSMTTRSGTHFDWRGFTAVRGTST